MITLTTVRTLKDIEVDCTIEEVHTDSVGITEHPVERGAQISDHAYMLPRQLLLRAGWSNSSPKSGGDEGYVKRIYDKLLALQVSREPFDVITGKRRYADMLFDTISVTTDQTTDSALSLVAMLRQVIIVETSVTQLPPKDNQADPKSTAAPVERGTVQPKATNTNPEVTI